MGWSINLWICATYISFGVELRRQHIHAYISEPDPPSYCSGRWSASTRLTNRETNTSSGSSSIALSRKHSQSPATVDRRRYRNIRGTGHIRYSYTKYLGIFFKYQIRFWPWTMCSEPNNSISLPWVFCVKFFYQVPALRLDGRSPTPVNICYHGSGWFM